MMKQHKNNIMVLGIMHISNKKPIAKCAPLHWHTPRNPAKPAELTASAAATTLYCTERAQPWYLCIATIQLYRQQLRQQLINFIPILDGGGKGSSAFLSYKILWGRWGPRSRALPKKGPCELRTKCGFTFGNALFQILVKSLTKAITGCKALC